jgi:anti-sigma factor RsiW
VTDEHAVWSSRVDEYLDGSLDRVGIREVEDHLEGCPACREELGQITALRRQARSLPREVATSRDLWPAIAARIAASESAEPAPVHDISPRRRPVVPWGWLAAAAVILVVVTSGATALLLRGPLTGRPGPVASAESPQARPAGLAAFASAAAEYEYTVATLEAELEARRGHLQPETIAAVEENLAIIDLAIAEARAALAADPSSVDLPLLLSGVYRQKVELLQRAVELTART